MAKGDTLENDLLKLIFNADAIANEEIRRLEGEVRRANRRNKLALLGI